MIVFLLTGTNITYYIPREKVTIFILDGINSRIFVPVIFFYYGVVYNKLFKVGTDRCNYSKEQY